MSFFRNLVGNELIDIVEWLDDSSDTMVYRFERPKNEIKNGAQLIVRPSQLAVFVERGQIADVFGPGHYVLTTLNLPILSTLRGWKHGFESPFKAEVLFVSTRIFTNRKWGTKNPVMLRDAEFGPVRLRAFGNYSVRVSDGPRFVEEIVGTNGRFTVEQIGDQLRDLVVARFGELLGENRTPILDLAANYGALGEFVAERIRPDFARYGLEITQVVVENISLPPEVEVALDRRTSMGIVGDLGRYAQYQGAEALREAAQNPGGGAGAGLGMGMGFAMANQMAQATPGAPTPARPPAAPPPLPEAQRYWMALGGEKHGPVELAELRRQAEAGALTRETLVWRAGMEAWAPAGEVGELAGVFATTPPPLP